VFSYGDYLKESSFNILPDPRQETSSDEFDKKENLLNKIHSDVNDIYESLTKMQDARSQIKDLQNRLGSEYSDIVELSNKTLDLIDETETKLISPKQKTFQDVINFRNQLDAQLMDLLSTVNRNAPPITNGQLERFEDLHSTWLEIRDSYDKILSNISSINTKLIESSVPYISKGQ
jgi:chromosome segregation ATPase